MTFGRGVRFGVRLEFKLRDSWIGAYWERWYTVGNCRLDVWLCLLPMLPLRLTVQWPIAVPS